MADWSLIHSDILSQIFMRITSLSDHIRISSVCSWWRSVALQCRYTLPHPIPFLVVVNSAKPNLRQLLYFPENVSHDHNLCVPPRDRCCGSYKGWLFLILEGSNSIYLLNPFIKRCIVLPPLRYPFVADEIIKAVLSSSPSLDCNCIVLILFTGCVAVFCKPGDNWWTILPGFDVLHADLSHALFFGHRLYVADGYGNVYTCNFDNRQLQELFPPRMDGSTLRERWYLVELSGQICRVQRIFDICDCGRMGFLDLTQEFRVWKMDPNKKCWIRVQDLGEYALFLGFNNSIAVSELTLPGIKGNLIYFTDHRCGDLIDKGIFDLDDLSFESLYSTQCTSLGDPSAVWVAPIPW